MRTGDENGDNRRGDLGVGFCQDWEVFRLEKAVGPRRCEQRLIGVCWLVETGWGWEAAEAGQWSLTRASDPERTVKGQEFG